LSFEAPPASDALTKAVLCRSFISPAQKKGGHTNFHNPLFHCPLDNVPRDEDWFILTQSVNSINGLLFYSFIPPCVHHEYV
jgi:hypothetical protein